VQVQAGKAALASQPEAGEPPIKVRRKRHLKVAGRRPGTAAAGRYRCAAVQQRWW